MSAEDRDDEREYVETGHLDGVADGCGCAEVWEHLSAGREQAADERPERDATGERAEPADD